LAKQEVGEAGLKILVLGLALALVGCATARERSLARFVRGEVFSEELNRQAEALTARRIAEQKCRGQVKLRGYEDGTDPGHWECIPR
jgi:hypothetical protein